MTTRVLSVLAVAVLALSACAPQANMIAPQELIVDAPYDEVFSDVTQAIGTMPYPDNTSGWVLINSDQAGGFISAQISGENCILLSCTPFTDRVSVALNARGETTTAVNVSRTRGDLAQDLADRITGRLRRM